MSEQRRLTGAVAAITGGGSGIGLSLARQMSAAGGSVLLVGRSAAVQGVV